MPETYNADFLARLDGAPFPAVVDDVRSAGTVEPTTPNETARSTAGADAGTVAVAALTVGVAIALLLAVSLVARRRRSSV